MTARHAIAGLAVVGVATLVLWLVLFSSRPTTPPAPSPAVEQAAATPANTTADDTLRQAFAVDPAHLADNHETLAPTPRIWRKIQSESPADARRPPPGDLRGDLRILDFAELHDYPLYLPPIDAEAARAAAYVNQQIPSRIKALNGKQVRLEGFLFPVALTDGKATTYLLMADYLKCCFADLSGPNTWAVVTDPKGLDVDLATPVIVTGTLSVGAQPLAAAGVTSIYRITATDSKSLPPLPAESPFPDAF